MIKEILTKYIRIANGPEFVVLEDNIGSILCLNKCKRKKLKLEYVQ